MNTNNALNYICNRIKNSDRFEDAYNNLLLSISYDFISNKDFDTLSEHDYRELLKYSDILSNSNNEEDRTLSLKIVSALYHFYSEDDACRIITKSILIKLGLFSAEEKFVGDNIQLPSTFAFESEFRRLNQKIKGTDLIFTNSQFKIFESIISNDYFSFSGPTSLGKSFLIKHVAIELIKNNNFIVFILPTKALLEEYLIDFKKIIIERRIEKKTLNINVTKSVSRVDLNKKNILIFTQERYNSFLFEEKYKNLTIDYLFVDEAHKLLDSKNNRALTLYKVIAKSLDIYPSLKLVFSSPVISNPDIFFKTFNLNNEKKRNSLCIKESPVNQDLYFINHAKNECIYFDSILKKTHTLRDKINFKDDFDVIYMLSKKSHSNLIYVSSKIECVKKCEDFLNFMVAKKSLEITKDDELLAEAKNIREYIHDDFNLSQFLKYGIAYHHGSLPIFIRKRIEDLYSRKKIKYMFCTSTLLEGVNLPTKNVFIYPFPKRTVNDTKKCQLDFWNLAGRAGRYKNELTGNIICINTNVENWDEVRKKVDSKSDVAINDEISVNTKKHIKLLNYFNGITKAPDNTTVQIATMVLSEILEFNKSGIIGSLLLNFKEDIRNKIISAGLNHLRKRKLLDINVSTFSENHIFNSRIQSEAYKAAQNTSNILRSYTRESIFNYLKTINTIYELRSTDDSLRQLCIVVYSWLRGATFSQLISDAIKFSGTVRDLTTYQWIDFDRNNPQHINAKILEVINCIENEITFKLETNISHFYQLCQSIHGADNAGINLSPYLEYGTLDSSIIELQEMGLSRFAAIEIQTKYKNCIIREPFDKSLSLNVKKLKAEIKLHGIIDRELSWLNL